MFTSEARRRRAAIATHGPLPTGAPAPLTTVGTLPMNQLVRPLARLGAPLAAGALALASSRPASARPIFPPEIQSHLMLPEPPACTLCHSSLAGGRGTVVKPFGMTARSEGLSAESSLAELDAVLDKMAASGVDSNGDGVPDIEELKKGGDPNASGDKGASPSVAPPAYGCGASATIAGEGPDRAPGLVAGALSLAALAFASRRRSR